MRKIIFILLLFVTGSLYSQPVTWSRIYGGGMVENGFYVQQTFDGGYIISGVGSHVINSSQIYIIKIDYLGNIEWEKLYGYGVGTCIKQTNDSGYILCGRNNNYAFLLRLNNYGDSLWLKTYSFNNYGSNARSLTITIDSGYIFCGTNDFPPPNPTRSYVVKTDKNGNLQWQKYFIDTLDSHLYNVIVSNDGYYYLTGLADKLSPTVFYGLFIKLNSNGEINKCKLIGNGVNKYLILYNILQNNNTSYIINGVRDSLNKFYSNFIVIDSSGFIRQNKLNDAAYDGGLCKINDNKFVISGVWFPSIRFDFLDSLGNILYYTLNTPTVELNSSQHLIRTTDGGLITTGESQDGINYVLVIKTDSNGISPPIGIKKISNEIPQSFLIYQNYPNPFNPVTVISYELAVNSFVTLKIFDILGKEVEILVDKNFKAGKYSIKWSPKNMPSGIYFCSMYVNDKIVQSIKLIMLK
jgi:hypothetical protein